MGGLCSGRKRLHTCIDDCLAIDTTWLKKQKMLQSDQSFSITWRKWKEIDFKERTEQEHKVRGHIDLGEHPTLTLTYQTVRSGDGCETEQHSHKHTLYLVSTPCNYGGQRWWFTAPCCQRRVRVLYIAPRGDIDQMTPMCRDCQNLHYASQCASYIERHISYEKHLLRNMGYCWAAYEYRAMKEHYFKITPEYAMVARRSQLERELEITKLFIGTQRFLANMKLRQLKYALKTGQISETDKATLFRYATDLELVLMLKHGVAIERHGRESNLTQPLPVALSLDDIRTVDNKVQNIVSDEDLLAAAEAGLTSNISEMITKRDQLQAKIKRMDKAA